MASKWNGSGQVIRDDGTRTGSDLWTQAKNAGVKILASDHDTHDQNIVDSIEKCLNLDAENSPSTDISWGSNKITNLADATASGDAVAYGQATVNLTSTDAGATAAPTLTLYRNSASPAASDEIGQLKFDGEDSGGATTTYGRIYGEIRDATDTSEDGRINMEILNAGTAETVVRVGSGPNVTIEADNSGATADPSLSLYRNSPSPAASDVIGELLFEGEDSADNQETYARIYAEIVDPTSASEDGRLNVEVVNGGSAETVMVVEGPNLTLQSADAGATADPTLTLYRNSASPAANDFIGELNFDGEDTAGNQDTFAGVYAELVTATSTAEDGALALAVVDAGTYDNKLVVAGATPNMASGVLHIRDDSVAINQDGNAGISTAALFVTADQTSDQVIHCLQENSGFDADILRLGAERGDNVAWAFTRFFEDTNGTNTERFRVESDGQVRIATGQTFDADLGYGEFMEWDDGNPAGEDRVGVTVVNVPETGKIRVAVDGEMPIGVVSGVASGHNAAALQWYGVYERDQFGRIKKDNQGQSKKNPQFVPDARWKSNREANEAWNAANPNKRPRRLNVVYDQDGNETPETLSANDGYVERRERKEWDIVSFVGQEFIRDDAPKDPRWVKLKSNTSPGVSLWLVR